MSRPALRSAAVVASAAVAIAGAACTSAQSPDPTTETTEPVPVEPNQEVTGGVPAPTQEQTGAEG